MQIKIKLILREWTNVKKLQLHIIITYHISIYYSISYYTITIIFAAKNKFGKDICIPSIFTTFYVDVFCDMNSIRSFQVCVLMSSNTVNIQVMQQL